MQATISTPIEMIEHLVSGLPDDLFSGVERLDKAAHQARLQGRLGLEMQADLDARGTLHNCLTPRDQMRQVLRVMALAQTQFWMGPTAMRDLIGLHRREVLPTEISMERLAAAYAFPIAVQAHSRMIWPLVALVQPFDGHPPPSAGEPVAPAYHMLFQEAAGGIGLHPARTALPVTKVQLSRIFSTVELKDRAAFHGPDAVAEIIAATAETLAYEMNEKILRLLAVSSAIVDAPYTAEDLLYQQTGGVPTARFMGPAAARRILGDAAHAYHLPYAALVRVSDMLSDTFIVPSWAVEFPNTVLLVRSQPAELVAPLAYLPWLWVGEMARAGAGDQEVLTHTVRHFLGLDVVEPRLLARIDLK